jgi:hypothetical protein
MDFPSPSLLRLATVVRVLVLIGALVLASVPYWLWGSPESLQHHARHNLGLAGPLAIDAATQAAVMAAGLPGLALGFFLLWQLWQLFGEYRRGHVFGRRALLHLRRFAQGVLAVGVVAPLTRTADVLVLTWNNPPGQRQLMIGFSSDDYLHVLLGAVLLAIAVVMAQAAHVAEENAGFV